MNYNTMLVQLDLDSAVAPRLEFALDLAGRFEADLIAYCAGEPQFNSSRAGGGVFDLLEARTKEVRDRLRQVKEEFDRIAGEREHISWRGEIGNPTEKLARNARAADLLIASIPPHGKGGARHLLADPAALVLSTGRPVFMINEEHTPFKAGAAIVAWTDTREARRAVADAIPLLRLAGEVVVTTVDETDLNAARESAADVVRYLMRHGAKAKFNVMDIGVSDVESALIQAVSQVDADLIVAGAFGHSRLREWVFGGVTRSLLENRSVHRFLSN